jgi:ferredoxin
MFAKVFAGSDAASLRTLHSATWWLHLLLVMGFIVTIPFTKFRHIVTTSLNYFFADLGPTGKLVTINLEDEKVEHFGASKVKDLTWKDIFDADACTQCKRCQDRCPAHMTKKPLSPMQLVNRIGTVAFHSPEANLIEACDKDAIWSCTTCRACQEICPAGIEHVNKVVDIRRHQVLMEGVFPGQEVMTAMEQTEVNSNPLGMAFAGRGDWAQALGVKSLAEDPVVDLLYFVGCYASFASATLRSRPASSVSARPQGSRSESSAKRRSVAASRCASSATNTFTRALPARISRRSRATESGKSSPPARTASTL